jgi:hypothetical protein
MSRLKNKFKFAHCQLQAAWDDVTQTLWSASVKMWEHRNDLSSASLNRVTRIKMCGFSDNGQPIRVLLTIRGILIKSLLCRPDAYLSNLGILT